MIKADLRFSLYHYIVNTCDFGITYRVYFRKRIVVYVAHKIWDIVAEACTSSSGANSTTSADRDIQEKTAAAISDDERKKRPRTAFTAAQIKSLEAEFERNKYLSVAKRLQLSKNLKLTETQVNILMLMYKLIPFFLRDLIYLFHFDLIISDSCIYLILKTGNNSPTILTYSNIKFSVP